MNWETVIGLETHVELSTRTKAFCSCENGFGGEPNTRCCPICTGMPGTLPVVNRKAVEFALQAGLALNCTPTMLCRFDRKNYFYPDLPKAYQISQLYLPLCRNGSVSLPDGSSIGIHELHLEEDAGKLMHDEATGQTRVDFNRCGVPLVEIVTEPDFRSSEQVLAYLEHLRSVLQYLEVSDCKLQEGSLRCDVNLSVRQSGSTGLGVRTEMKNLSSFRAISRAIAYESRRQISVLEHGDPVQLETRRWDESREITIAMRPKESIRDYRYYPDPDIPPLHLTSSWIRTLKQRQPELAQEKIVRYQRDFGLPLHDARTITAQKSLAVFFESAVREDCDPKQVSNWILGPVLAQLSASGTDAGQMRFTPESLAHLIRLVRDNQLNRNTAVRVLEAVFADNGDIDAYIEEHSLRQVSDMELVSTAVRRVLADNPKGLEDYRAGKQKAFGFLVGQTMHQLNGQAAPRIVRQVLQQILDSDTE